MKKLFSVILLAAVCLSAAAQESKLLNDWQDKIEINDNSVVSSFSHFTFFYNHNLNAQNVEGLTASGLGFEISTLYLGFRPWNGGRLALGLVDFCLDKSYLDKGYLNAYSKIKNAVLPTPIPANFGFSNINGTVTSFAFLFPLAFVQEFGKGQIALMAAPGVGWNSYFNEYLEDDVVKHRTRLTFDKGGAYFRLNLSAFFWYSHIGVGVRYSFQPNMQAGPGVVSVGLSIGI